MALQWAKLAARNCYQSEHECGQVNTRTRLTWVTHWPINPGYSCASCGVGGAPLGHEDACFGKPWWSRETVGPGIYRTEFVVKPFNHGIRPPPAGSAEATFFLRINHDVHYPGLSKPFHTHHAIPLSASTIWTHLFSNWGVDGAAGGTPRQVDSYIDGVIVGGLGAFDIASQNFWKLISA